MENCVRYPGAGCIVEFLQGNKIQTAWVVSEQSGKYRLLTSSMREVKIAVNRILPWAGPALTPDLTREQIKHSLEAYSAKRQNLADVLDIEAVWELAQGEVERASALWCAQLLDDAPNVDKVAAMGRAMLARKTHFKFQPPDFEVYPREVVEQRIAKALEQEKREKTVSAGQEFFHILWKKYTSGCTTDVVWPDQELAASLKNILFTAMAEETDSAEFAMWTALRKGLPDEPYLALFLAIAWGIVPEHFHVQLLQEGYVFEDDWTAPHTQELEELEANLETNTWPLEHKPYISIDAASTTDIDDALFIEKQDKANVLLHIALTCPSFGWKFGSPLDHAVRERASSLYLPEGTSHMLPQSYGLRHFSLAQGEERCALVIKCLLTPQAELLEVTPSLARVKVSQNMTYHSFGEQLAADGESGIIKMLGQMGEALRCLRIGRGAVIIDRPEPVITLHRENSKTVVEIEEYKRDEHAHTVVSECMILANAALGSWALTRGIPLLYRTQDITFPGDIAGVWTDPVDIHRIVRYMAPGIQEVSARPHATLAVSAYAPVTSPLRRYSDMVNQAQVLHFLEAGKPRWDKEALKLMLPVIAARTGAAGRIQRYRPRYWKLCYIKQHRDRFFDAVVVGDDPVVTLTLPKEQIQVRCPAKKLGDKIYPGQRFGLRFGKIDPLRNELTVAEALEN